MILTSIERMQIAWFHFEEGLSFMEVAYLFDTKPLLAMIACNEFKELYGIK